jgi:hypothetical protein
MNRPFFVEHSNRRLLNNTRLPDGAAQFLSNLLKPFA